MPVICATAEGHDEVQGPCTPRAKLVFVVLLLLGTIRRSVTCITPQVLWMSAVCAAA